MNTDFFPFNTTSFPYRLMFYLHVVTSLLYYKLPPVTKNSIPISACIRSVSNQSLQHTKKSNRFGYQAEVSHYNNSLATTSRLKTLTLYKSSKCFTKMHRVTEFFTLINNGNFKRQNLTIYERNWYVFRQNVMPIKVT